MIERLLYRAWFAIRYATSESFRAYVAKEREREAALEREIADTIAWWTATRP